ncbi:ATP-binding protein [Calothrix sp. FACHB-1219]|uniref:ATP-binding protein n=1 Tax=unclassified Calothrix TaxID=2619626 RepID=UPI001681F39D|nr:MULTISPECIES: ATP-binding protein [unclassified Calothrix]MBD2201347.1 ATP-binding protein [Calothrix sp. FACHB-168]MBD2215781.1 ATP-binding protein [Calothrix sp. FACHB-1219]
MSKELLELFQEAYSNLELFPLMEKNEMEKFRVEYGDDLIADLNQLVEDSPNGDSKIIFTGHRGCGKSTLLAEFSRQIQNNYFVVLFSIADKIEMSAVNHINILFAIAVNLMSEAEARQVEIPQSTKEALYQWFATRTRTEELNFKAEAEIGFDLLKLISSKLKADATVRDEIKQEFERKISDLVARINEIAALIQTATKQDVLVIIDDLDKLDLGRVNEIYKDNIKALCQPNFRIIYTIPIAVLRETFISTILTTETNDQIVVMPVLKIFEKGKNRLPHAQPRPETIKILGEVLQKRIASELIAEQTAEKIVIYSGGVLRELIRIAKECCRICLRLIRRNSAEEIIIDDNILFQAINKIRNDFSIRLGRIDIDILQNVYKQFMPNDPKQPEFLDLLHGLYVLEYRTDETWYDVHPILIESLKNKGVIYVE